MPRKQHAPDPPISPVPAFAIIIPHYNDVPRLLRCLDALVPQAGDDVEIVVADNNSTADLTPVHARFPTLRIVTEAEKGAGPARNRGVAETTAPWLMFLDADCLPAADWLATGRRIAAEDTVIGGRVDVFHETPPPKSGAEAFETVFAFKMGAYLARDGFLGSGNLVTSRKVFETTGGFRAAVSEDVDWSTRAAAAGFRLAYDDTFAAGHPSRQDWPALARKWRRLASEGFLFGAHDAGARALWALKALAMPASALVHTPRVLAHPDLTAPEKARALVTLLRIRFMRMIWMLGQAITGRA